MQRDLPPKVRGRLRQEMAVLEQQLSNDNIGLVLGAGGLERNGRNGKKGKNEDEG